MWTLAAAAEEETSRKLVGKLHKFVILIWDRTDAANRKQTGASFLPSSASHMFINNSGEFKREK